MPINLLTPNFPLVRLKNIHAEVGIPTDAVMPASRSSDRGGVHDGHVPRILGRRRAEADETGSLTFQLRPYQLEMLEESMRRNIIVAVRNSKLRKVLQAECV